MQVSLIVGGKDQTLDDLAALADGFIDCRPPMWRLHPQLLIHHLWRARAHKETRSPHITKTTTNSVPTQKIAQQVTRWIGLTTRQILLVSQAFRQGGPSCGWNEEKLTPGMSSAQGIPEASRRQLFITDRSSKLKFLVDTGADVSVLPVAPKAQDLHSVQQTTPRCSPEASSVGFWAAPQLPVTSST